ncbi:MAG TPA: hypothetical protein VJM32_01195 [Candidatus Saccharimonadales bacterium]|nr:hypothetical protein [Candidatus Saccharimonadales bacterium]
MCTVNHPGFAKPGYLIDIACESIAPKVMFSRMLSYHAEIGLTADQVMALLTLNAEYQQRLFAIRIEFAQVTERMELKGGRLDTEALVARKELLDQHMELFRAEEELFFEYGARGHDLLTDEQIAKADAVYHTEKNAALATLAESLNNAVGPQYQFTAALQ